MKIFVITILMSPYQVELFDEIAKLENVDLLVGYLTSQDPTRMWSTSKPRHKFSVLMESDEKHSWEEFAVSADIVIFSNWTYRYVRHLIRIRRRSRLPWVFWGERPGFNHLGIFSKLLRWFLLSDLRLTSAPIWGIGAFAIEGYKCEFGLNRQYFNVPYYSDLSRFRQSELDTNYEDKSRVILYSGSLIKRKGVDVLADAFALARFQHAELKLRFVGSGPLELDLRKKLLKFGDAVTFVGFKDWGDLPEEYGKAHFLCVPSRYDGWGLVVPEGLAAGLPIIASDRVGAAREMVVDGQNGWNFRTGSTTDLSKILSNLATMPWAQYRSLSERSVASSCRYDVKVGAVTFCRTARTVIRQWC